MIDRVEEECSSMGISNPMVCFDEFEDEESCDDAVSIEKMQPKKISLRACWKDDLGMAEVVEYKNHMLNSIGIIRDGNIYFFIEETLYLAEPGELVLIDDKEVAIPLGVMYEKLADGSNGCSSEVYKVYKHLKSLGYSVRRYGASWSLKSMQSRPTISEGTSDDNNLGQTAMDETSITQLVTHLHIEGVQPKFEVYVSNGTFKKTDPGKPDYLVYVARGPPPSRSDLEELKRQCGDVPLIIGHVDHARVSFFYYEILELPGLP